MLSPFHPLGCSGIKQRHLSPFFLAFQHELLRNEMNNKIRTGYFIFASLISIIGALITNEVRRDGGDVIGLSTIIIVTCICISYLIREFKSK